MSNVTGSPSRSTARPKDVQSEWKLHHICTGGSKHEQSEWKILYIYTKLQAC